MRRPHPRGPLALLTPIVDAGIDVALMGLFDIWRSGVIPEPVASNLAPRFDEFDRLSAEVAAAVGAIFIDLHSHRHARDPAIFASDRMHCNARGHAIAGTVAIEALAERLASRER